MKGLLFSSITPSFIYMTGYKEVTEVCTTPFIYLDGSMYEVLIRSLAGADQIYLDHDWSIDENRRKLKKAGFGRSIGEAAK